MEYSNLREIESSIGFVEPSMGFRLTSTPAFDYVNPGVGQVSSEDSIYVPIYSNNSPYAIEKIGSSNQDGEGAKSEDIEMQKGDPESVTNPLEYNEKKRKLMGTDIHESFLHPKKIKTAKLTLPSAGKGKSEIHVKKTLQSHKFKLV